MRLPGREAGSAAARRDPNVLISIVASAASAGFVLTIGDSWGRVQAAPVAFLGFVALTLALQLVSISVYSRGATNFASAGLLALGFTFGPGAAMTAALLRGIATFVARRGRLNRGVFDAAQLSLAAAAGALSYQVADAGSWAPALRILPALAAGMLYMAVNVGLLCLAMSLADRASPLELWKERFRWLTPYYLAAGPLALAVNFAYEEIGMTGLLAFTLPPLMMMISMRQYVSRTRKSVDEVRRANEELRLANVELAARNDDLSSLFELAGGLAARAHDPNALVSYAEERVGRLAGTRARVSLDGERGGIELVSGGTRVASLELEEGPAFDAERWERLRDAILPQLATAIESTNLIEEVRKKHLATIAALSRSMEAKDYYTGGHTERVSGVAVALAARLGYSGADLDAIEIGALLHDIGKIGIPERILHKQGPLDEEEWKVMKEHPVISEYILSGVDLSPVVLEVARSSHERMDGKGYPDGLAGEEIPLPARIVLVADAFDALTSDRPYRRGRHTLEAIQELEAHAGTQFCPLVVDALRCVYREEPLVLGAGTLRAVEVA